jgi:hypothetical protein
MWWVAVAYAAEMTFGWHAGDAARWTWSERGALGAHQVTLAEAWREAVVSGDRDGAVIRWKLESLDLTLDGRRALSLTDVPEALRTVEVRFDRRGRPTIPVMPIVFVDGDRLVLARRDNVSSPLLVVDPRSGAVASAPPGWSSAGLAEIELVPASWWAVAALPPGDLSEGSRQDHAGVRTSVASTSDSVAVLRLSRVPQRDDTDDAFEVDGAPRPPVVTPAEHVVDVALEQRVNFVRLERYRIEGTVVRSFPTPAGDVTFRAEGTLERAP